MKALSIQVLKYDKPLLGATHAWEHPSVAWRWYDRVLRGFGCVEPKISHLRIARGAVQAHEQEAVLSLVQSKIQQWCSKNKGHCLIVDLSSFYCRYPAWRAGASGWSRCFSPFRVVVVIFDPLASAIREEHLVGLYRERKAKGWPLVVLNSDGRVYDAGDDGLMRSTFRYELRRDTEALSEKEFRVFLLQKSDRFLGHFILPKGAHVRTHYDLYPVVANPRAYEYIVGQAQDMAKERAFDLLVGFGLGSKGLTSLCEKLGQSLGLPSLFYGEPTKELLEEQINRGSSRVLLVSDVVLTGKTASDHVKEIHNLGGEVTSILAVMGLTNSHKEVDGIPVRFCIQLNRPFYLDEGSCPLCRTGAIKPHPVKFAENFQEAVSARPSHYDFWEFASERGVLQIGHQIGPNGLNHYVARVNTARVLSRYGGFIAAVLAQEIKTSLGQQEPAHVIACPLERGALHLAYALASKLGIPNDRIVGIPRSDIERCPPSGGDPQVVKRYRERLSFPVLAVDDGTNSLHTFNHLISLLRSAGAAVVGYAVFLNAVDDKQMQVVRNTIGRNFFIFYRWRLGPFTRGQCPVCPGQLAGGGP